MVKESHFRFLRRIFNLRPDCDEEGTVENIRKNVDFHGANAWTLVFAIFVASIGLNMNSTAVIIGAMLISPLMGPILGFGLALGINDGELLKRSLRNLSIAVFISVLTSTIYFLLSPLHDAQSELLARTQPTFYDVLIAFFGGAAGIVSISRKERGQAVAGVAIATALMPPLCTAGFALSSGNLRFLAGAIYLFLINSVFIALSTFIFVRYMNFQVVKLQDPETQSKVRRWVAGVAAVMVVPSLVLAWSLLQESRFRLNSERFLREQFHFKNSFAVEKTVHFSYSRPRIEIAMVGDPLSAEQIEILNARLPSYGLGHAELGIRQSNPEDRTAPRGTLLEAEIASLRQRLAEQESRAELTVQLLAEVRSLFPEVSEVLPGQDTYYIVWGKKPPRRQSEKLETFLRVRVKSESLRLLHLTKA